MARKCKVCEKQVRHYHGEYPLCRACSLRLEMDIAKWRDKLSDDLDKIVAFDAHLAERDNDETA